MSAIGRIYNLKVERCENKDPCKEFTYHRWNHHPRHDHTIYERPEDCVECSSSPENLQQALSSLPSTVGSNPVLFSEVPATPMPTPSQTFSLPSSQPSPRTLGSAEPSPRTDPPVSSLLLRTTKKGAQ